MYLSSVAQKRVVSMDAREDSILKVIHLTSKSFVKDNKILLEWNSTRGDGFYIVERSFDLKGFEVLGVLKSLASNKKFEFMDEKPSIKKNYYRITMQFDENRVYSDTVTAGITDSVFCKFYPNPVDNLLILRSDYAVALKIADLTGKTRILQQMKPGLQTLDVSCLEKSIYIITIFHEESNQFITRKLIKN